jgi:hypothetical protein
MKGRSKLNREYCAGKSRQRKDMFKKQVYRELSEKLH